MEETNIKEKSKKMVKNIWPIMIPTTAVVFAAIVTPTIVLSNLNSTLKQEKNIAVNKLEKKNSDMEAQLISKQKQIGEIYGSANQFLGVFSEPSKKIDFLSTKSVVKGLNFKGEKGLTYIDMPDVTEIKYGGFQQTPNLSEIYFDNLETLGAFAFQGAFKLHKVSMPKLKVISRGAFDSDRTLSNFDFKNIESIGSTAFGRVAITELVAPNLKELGTVAFDQVKLTKITIPSLVEEELLKAKDAFSGIINQATTVVTLSADVMKSSNLTKIKDTIFGSGKYDKITFKSA